MPKNVTTIFTKCPPRLIVAYGTTGLGSVCGISHTIAYRSFVLFLCAELEYAEALIPSAINVYETYNPGAVVRILACNSDPAEKNNPGEVE